MGGLLMVQEAGNSYLPAYDAVGNVHAMIQASDGSLAACYDGARQGGDGQTEGLPEGRGPAGHPMGGGPRQYDAFGNTLRESGSWASNPFRFATKYTDIETGLVQYNTRYYSPSLGRFINRDTISEAGGLNLYAYVSNRVPNAYDYLGMNPPGVGTWGSYYGFGPFNPSPRPTPAQIAATQIGGVNQLLEFSNQAGRIYNYGIPLGAQTMVNFFNGIPHMSTAQSDPSVARIVGQAQMALASLDAAKSIGIMAAGRAATISVPGYGQVVGVPAGLIGAGKTALAVESYLNGLENYGNGIAGRGTGRLEVPFWAKPIPDAPLLSLPRPATSNNFSATPTGILSAPTGNQSNTFAMNDPVLRNVSTENIVSITIYSDGSVVIVTNGAVKSAPSNSGGKTDGKGRDGSESDEEEEEASDKQKT